MFVSIPLEYKNPDTCMRVSVIFLSYGLEKVRIFTSLYLKFCFEKFGYGTEIFVNPCLAQAWQYTILLKLKLSLFSVRQPRLEN